MGLIKSTRAVTTTSFSMQDVEEQARIIVLRARQQADQLLAATLKEGEDLKQKMSEEAGNRGHEEGFARGLEEGRQAGRQAAMEEHRQELSGLITALRVAMQQFDASRNELETAAVAEVIELAIAIARRVTRRQAQLDPDVLKANLADAMKLVVSAQDLCIVVHPDQKQLLNQMITALKVDWPALEHAQLVADEKIAPGGCRITTRGGEIDARLEEQLDRVVAELMPAAAKTNIQHRTSNIGH